MTNLLLILNKESPNASFANSTSISKSKELDSTNPIAKKTNLDDFIKHKTEDYYIKVSKIDFKLLILKSALYSYVKNENRFPESLDDLTKPYPNNYLSQLPSLLPENEYPVSKSWIYDKPTIDLMPQDDAGLIQLINDSIKANVEPYQEKYMEKPLQIIVFKKEKELQLLGNGYIYKKYMIEIGNKRNPTPEGNFTITKKVINPSAPDSRTKYGTRGMEFKKEYAIHGSSDGNLESTIGCISMTKSDIEELYSILPKGSKVIIKPKKNSEDTDGDTSDNIKDLSDNNEVYTLNERSEDALKKEKTDTLFNWRKN